MARDSHGGKFVTPVYSVSVTLSELGAGYGHACAVDRDHKMWCWGKNSLGQLGDGTRTDSNYKVPVVGTQVWEKTASQWVNSYGIDDHGVLWGWGSNQYYGLPGNSTSFVTTRPVVVSDTDYFIQVASFNLTECALTVDGKLYCWGANYNGQVGVGYAEKLVSSLQLIKNRDSTGWISVSVGNVHTCAIDENLQLWCWGDNYYGEYGEPGVSNLSPGKIGAFGTTVDQVTAMSYGTCALLGNKLYCAGSEAYGELGDGESWFEYPVKTTTVSR